MPEELPETARRLCIQIAIDGLAGAGKSTVGRGLARALGCAYLDTGIMYRAVTLQALRSGVPLDDSAALARIAASVAFAWSPGSVPHILVDGASPDEALRGEQVDLNVSQVSAHAPVRAVLVRRQRELAAGRCVVMAGRDIGTVVLADAPLKLWITASPEERARRREAEQPACTAEVVRRVHRRDRIDAGRPVSPAAPAADAVVLDTDELSPEASVQAALREVQAVLARGQAWAR